MSALTVECLRQILSYDPISGVFCWLVRAGPRAAGSVAGSPEQKGYVVIGINGKIYKAHRLAYLYMKGEWPSGQIDHRNTIRADNRWDNLRPADTSKNKANGPGYKNRKYDLPKGVYRTGRKFSAQIRVRGTCFYLGSHQTPEAAHAAYAVAAREHFGEFANVGG